MNESQKRRVRKHSHISPKQKQCLFSLRTVDVSLMNSQLMHYLVLKLISVATQQASDLGA